MLDRRTLLAAALGGIATNAVSGRSPFCFAANDDFDRDFGTAVDAVRAIREGKISCRELLDHVLARIQRHDPQVNAFLTLNKRASDQADAADAALAQGHRVGRLHGLPILVKDLFQTAGLRTTCGSLTLRNNVPSKDAEAVARLRAEGAIIVGKTNVPEFGADVQTYNEINGTANNPWDETRTPGGSTGGGAAALAAGFGFLELGSDLGGSIRTPASFCGVFGHKPTLNVVSMEGHIPMTTEHLPSDLSVAGPLARSAADLRLALEVLGGPGPDAAIAYRWRLPAPRKLGLKEYRIGYVLDDPFCRVTPEVLEVLTAAVVAFRKAGANLTHGWPPGVDPAKLWDTYYRLSAAYVSPFETEETLGPLRKIKEGAWARSAKVYVEGNSMPHKDWLAESVQRLNTRRVWQNYFKQFDAFLMPESFVPAFPHDHEKTFDERTLSTTLGVRPYGDILKWISIATLTGCPATAAPAGRTKQGLPVGIQIMGPYMEDATPIDIAGRLTEVVGGFEPPPAFAK